MLRALRAGGPTPARSYEARECPTRRSARTPDSSPSSCPARSPRLAIEPEWKAQPRLWGHTLHPMCSYLASFPAALAHAFIARYSRPGRRGARSVLGPRHRARSRRLAEGRIGVGNDLNPLAHLLTAAKVEPGAPGRGAHPARGAAARLERRRRPRGSTSASASWRGPGTRPRSCRRAGCGDGPDAAGPSPSRTRSRSRSTRGRSRQLLLLRSRLDLDDRDRPVPRRRDRGDPPRQDAGVPVDDHAQHVQHGAALRPRLRGSAPASEPPERDAFDALSAKLDRLYRQPLPRVRRASRSWATRGPPAAARAPRCAPAACRTAPASSSPRRPTCGCSSTATTTGSGRGSSGSTPGRSTRRSTTPTSARRTSRSCARSSPTSGPPLTDDGIAVLVIGDVETDRGKPSKAGLGLRRARLGGGRVPGGLPPRGPRPGRGRRQPQDDPAVGRRGRAARRRPTGSSCSARPRPAAGARSRPRTCRSTGPGRRRGCAPL